MMEVSATPSPRGRQRPWHDLPPELLGLVLQRIPSHTGLVRFGTVCRTWLAGARIDLRCHRCSLGCSNVMAPSSISLTVRYAASPPKKVSPASCPRVARSFLCTAMAGAPCFNPFFRDTSPKYVANADRLCFRILSRDPVVYSVRKVVLMPDYIITIQKPHNQYNNILSIHGRRQSTTIGDIRWTPPVKAL
jgi:hypothetical protein